MNGYKLQIVLVAILCATFNSAFGYMPGGRSAYLGECGERMTNVTEERRQHERDAQAVQSLAGDVLLKKQLLIPQVKAVLGNYSLNEWVSTGPDNEDEFAIPQPASPNLKVVPLDYAERAEKLRPNLSRDEWDRTVTLWTNVLVAAAHRLRSLTHEDYCGPVATVESLAWDSTRIFWAPIWTTMFRHGWGGGENRPWVRQTLVLIAGTVPSLASDIGLALPNSYLRARDLIKHHPESDANRFADAVSDFDIFVQSLERNAGSHP